MSSCARRSIRARDKEEATLFAATPLGIPEPRPVHLAIVAGLACALLIARAAPLTRDLATVLIDPLCMTAAPSQDVVEPISSHALPNVAGKRVTVVRVFYGPGGFTPPHSHSGSVTAYVTKGEIRSQLDSGPVETFRAGQSFFEPPGTKHMVSANASITEPAELIAVFVADEGAELTTLLK
ncbi:MAG: cupin domain-containing protein [Bradyrhizobium sp.]|nr:cupin domain-containing protein [Bradyrhizobium sp.]